jgi:predicted aspartyl protease
MRSVYLAAIAYLMGHAVSVLAENAPTLPATEVPMTIDEVTVEAPEPRYVAPTLRDRIGRVWAPVYINDKGPFRLVLDTGATGSAVVSSVAQRLKIPISADRKIELVGATGSAIVPYIEVDKVEVGDLFLGDSQLPIVPDVFGGAEGVLGTKGLMDKLIFIDFRHDLIRITFSRQRIAPLGFAVLPFEMIRGRLVTLQLMVGGVRTRAIIDTGAQQTIGNLSLRDALVRKQREVKNADIIGVTLDVTRGESIATPPISLGKIELRNLRVTFGDMFIFNQWQLTRQPALLVGMDVIGSLDTFIIDYKRRELHLKARGF